MLLFNQQRNDSLLRTKNDNCKEFENIPDWKGKSNADNSACCNGRASNASGMQNHSTMHNKKIKYATPQNPQQVTGPSNMPSDSDRLSLAELKAEFMKLKTEVIALKSKRQVKCEYAY